MLMWRRIHWRERERERERNVEKRWSEHKNPTEKTEPARQLSNNMVTCLHGIF